MIKHTGFLLVGLGAAIAAVALSPGTADKPGAEVAPPASAPPVAPARFADQIRRPDGPPRIEFGHPGAPDFSVSCALCHSLRAPNSENRSSADLDEFHQHLRFSHGDLSCLSCHNPDDYDTLKLADQRPVPYREVMTLCGQCHGPQLRDYAHGAHGGMLGYWDRSRGPRIRANCVDCHDPHAPAFPRMYPTFKPRDRFLSPAPRDAGGGHE